MVSWLLSSNRSSHTNQCPSLQLQLQFHLTPPNPLLQRLCCSPSLCLLAGLPQAQWLSSLFSPSGQWAQPSGAQRGCLCGDSQRFKSPSHRVYYTFFFFKSIFYVARREEGDAVHLGHKNRQHSVGCKGELPAKCITSPRRQLPVDVLSVCVCWGWDWGRQEGFEGKEQTALLCSPPMPTAKISPSSYSFQQF